MSSNTIVNKLGPKDRRETAVVSLDMVASAGMKATVLKPMQKTSTCDNIGNRISSEDSGQTTEYVANELNQYTSVTSATLRELSYDPDGNMLTNGEWTYTWNGENRMVLASNASHVITFSHDFQGRCYEKIKDGVTNSYVWDDFNIITEISSAHTNQNVWGLDLSGSLQGAGAVEGSQSLVFHSQAHYLPLAQNPRH